MHSCRARLVYRFQQVPEARINDHFPFGVNLAGSFGSEKGWEKRVELQPVR